MAENVEEIIKNIELSMKMENISLSKEDKSRLRDCIKENRNFYEILQEIIISRTYNTEYVSIRQETPEID
jgi:hypothetical protein